MANLHFNSISLCLWLNWLPFCIDFSFRYLNPGHYRNTFPFSLWHTSQYAFSGMTDFISLGSKITADGDYNHEIKWCLLLGWKAMTKLGSILKSRDITLLAKVHIVKAIVSPVVMYRSENWTIKKAECQRFDAFEFCCWRRLLRVPWNARRSNQSILKEINLEYSLEGLMLKLKLHPLAAWCEETAHW